MPKGNHLVGQLGIHRLRFLIRQLYEVRDEKQVKEDSDDFFMRSVRPGGLDWKRKFPPSWYLKLAAFL